MNEEFERIVEMSAAYDKRNEDPSKNYGIHGVDFRMVLKGPKGAVQFVIYTNWHLPHVQEEMDHKVLLDPSTVDISHHPMPADVGYHSPKPMWESEDWPHKPATESCPYLDGKPCYYDGSTLYAEDVYKILLKKGSKGVWEELENCYREQFEEDSTQEGTAKEEE